MKILQKLGLSTLTFFMITSLLTVHTYAVNNNVSSEDDISVLAVSAETQSEIETLLKVESMIKEAALNGESSVDISSLNIHLDEMQGLINIQYFSPYLGNGISCSVLYNPSTNYYVKINIKTSMTADQIEAYFQMVDMKIQNIMGLVSADMSDETKALIVHDYLCINSEYDYENFQNNTVPDTSFSSGGLLMNGIGVCNGYAYAYSYLMNMMNIECYVTRSEEMYHAWNIIKIGDSYYHVDCTWDDPVYDRLGMVNHECFLASDQEMLENQEHFGWESDFVCSNTQYDQYYWKDIESPIYIVGDNRYYIDGNNVVKSNGEDIIELASLGRWYVWDNNQSYWNGSFSGLFLKNNELYFNTATQIKKISLDGDKETVVLTPDISTGYIYGMRLYNGELQYTLKKSYSDKDDIHSYQLESLVEVSSLTLNKQSVTLNVKKDYQLIADIQPSQATFKDLTWESSNTKIAEVDANGKVTAVAPGTATITAKTTNEKTATCKVTVKAPITGVQLDKTSLTLPKGTTAVLKATVSPSDTTDSKTIRWSSSNTDIAIVNSSGTVKGLRPGTATITATSSNGKKATCKVTVPYTITYKLNGGTNNKNNPATYTAATSTITLKNPTKKGYTFVGWYSDSSFKTKVTQIEKGSTGNRTLYAKWTYTKYKITYNLNGGTNSKSNPATYTVATSAITLKNPTKKGYTFAGWYSDSSFKTKVTKIEKGSTGNRTLYAKWTKVSVSKAKTPTLANVSGNKLKISYSATSGAKGYQIQYSTNSKFTNAATKTVTATSYTTKALVKNKTYYVRVRAYKTDSAGEKVYGSWSTVKNKKIIK